ncbi:patatin-like phospholipase family protein, partial [Thiomicrorhabdus sp. Kp2]|uniref:patatin-like phospholipase family protein n=1 Tax=Thiomicrorhabdus sp. Kp2 TaxID=1123518 RepID=UPI0005950598
MILSFSVILTGCSSYGVINNAKQTNRYKPVESDYSMKSVLQHKPQGKVALVLTFSGGGTRAAALAYGVLQELKETKVTINNKTTSLLDEVDIISAVSGGSFIAAYYGLNGKRTFKDFESVMLKKDFEDELISGVLNPLSWFGDTGRTEMAIQLYNNTIFKDATFADLNKPDSPLILINATDLANGARVSFTQDYFDFICSDISSFSVAKAVTASSAVPVLFNPVVLKNYQPCNNNAKTKLLFSESQTQNNIELQQAINNLKLYVFSDYPYLQLVDGGITDNLGLRAIYEAIEFSGGPKAFLREINKNNVEHIAVISVDASTQTSKIISTTNKSPTIQQSIDAVTDIQIHRYNASTTELFEKSLNRWGEELSTKNHSVQPHFIQVSFDQLDTEQEAEEFNHIPTRLSLTEPDVAKLIKTGRALLKNNFQFQFLLQELNTQTERISVQN